MSRLPLRFAALIVFFFSFLLFYSGWILQQQSLNALQEALNPHPPTPTDSWSAPPKSSKSWLHLVDQTDSKKPQSFTTGVTEKERKVAYIQYVSSKDKLCNSIMILAELHRLGTTADMVLLYPHAWVSDEQGTWNRLLKVAEQRYRVIVKAVGPLVEVENAPAVSLLHAFAETEYSRVLYLDSSGTVLRNLDELLFSAPTAPVAGVRAYWRSEKQAQLSDHLLLIEPSQQELERVKKVLHTDPKISPMGLINQLYYSHALILPPHPYDTLISEFRAESHERYVVGGWDSARIRGESYYVNFEDDETPKPWHILPRGIEARVKPKLSSDEKVWKAHYSDWARRRMDVCGLDLEPVPAGF